MIRTTRLRPQRPRALLKCDGYGTPYGGCYNKAPRAAWPGQYGGRNLCPDCAKRFKDENAYWARITG